MANVGEVLSAMAAEHTDDVAYLLGNIAGKLTDFVKRIRSADGMSVPPGPWSKA